MEELDDLRQIFPNKIMQENERKWKNVENSNYAITQFSHFLVFSYQ